MCPAKCSSRNRCHHLIKMFHSGPTGWTDEQRPDGTIAFRAPTGHVYTTEAHGGLLFPSLATATAPLTPPGIGEPSPNRGVMMPKRRTTRERDRRQRIVRERHQRLEVNAERERQRQAWLVATYEPPPF